MKDCVFLSGFVLRASFFLLCPLHQQTYRTWCWLCSRVTARHQRWSDRVLSWYVEPEEGERLIRPVQRVLQELRN